MDDWACIYCDEPIGMFDKVCRHCGERQFGENDEYYPDAKSMRQARKILGFSSCFDSDKESKGEIFNDAEKLSLGLHPNDEGIKMGLISRILNRK